MYKYVDVESGLALHGFLKVAEVPTPFATPAVPDPAILLRVAAVLRNPVAVMDPLEQKYPAVQGRALVAFGQ
jgi:hypothetical protein